MEPLLSSSDNAAPAAPAAAVPSRQSRASSLVVKRNQPPQHKNRNHNKMQMDWKATHAATSAAAAATAKATASTAATALKAQQIMTATGMCRGSSSSALSNSSTGSSHHFPSRLHDMLDGAERHQQTAIVSWCPDGRAFRIHQPEFMLPVLKQYFRQTKYKSLLRQLQAYNFARTTKGERKGTVSHPHFQRGRRSLCLAMKRKPNGATAAAAQHALVAQQQQATLMTSPALAIASAGASSSSSVTFGHVAKSAVKTKKMKTKTKKPAAAPARKRGSSQKGQGRATSAGVAAAAAASATQRGPTPGAVAPPAFGAASSLSPGLHPSQPYHPQSQSPLQPLPPPERLQQQKQLLEQHLQVQHQQQRQYQEQQWLALTEEQRQQLVTYFKTNNTGRVELSHLPQQQHLLQQQLLQQPAAANIPCHSRGYSDTLMDSLRVEIGCTVSTPTPTPSSHHMTSSEQHGPAAVVSSDSLCSNSKSKTLLAKNFAAAAGASGPGVSVPIPVEHFQLQTATVTAPSTLFPQQQRRRSTGMMMDTAAAVPKTSSTVSSFIKRYSSPTFAPTGVTVSTLQQQRRQQRHPPLHHHHHQPPSLERLRHHDRFASPLGELNITLSCTTRPEDAPPTTRSAAFQNHYILPPMFEPTPLALTATPSSEKYYQLYHATLDNTGAAPAPTAMAPSEEPVPLISTSAAAASAELTMGRCYHDVGDDAVCEECGYDGGGDDDHVTAGLVVDELMLPSCSDDIDAGIAEAFNVF